MLVGNLYKVSSSVEPLKYLLCVGVARQSEDYDSPVDVDMAEELANYNAFMNPTLTMTLDKEITDDDFFDLGLVFINRLQMTKLLKTNEEKNIVDVDI